MNQPPGGYFPPGDPYGGSGQKGGTIPGGPPPEVANQPGGAAAPMRTMVDQPVAPQAAAFTPPPGVPAQTAPMSPAAVAGPIGYAPSYAARARPRKGPWGLVLGIGLLGVLFIGGASAAVFVVRARSSTPEVPTVIDVNTAPPVVVAPLGGDSTDPNATAAVDTGAVAPPDTMPANTTTSPPAPATTTPKPPSTTTVKPPATSTTTAPPHPTTPPATTTAPPATTTAPPATTTAPPRWRPPIIIRPPATGTSTTTPPPTGTSTGTKPPRFKLPPIAPRKPTR